MRTLQETFDQMVAHLAKQGCRATKFQGMNGCVYWSPHHDKRCAIGALVSAETAEAMERKGGTVEEVWDVTNNELLVQEKITKEKLLSFYTRAQNAHDHASGIEDLKDRLHALALDHNLNPALVDTITEWKR